MAGSEEELKSLWVKVNEKNEKAGLKLNIQKTKIMASSPNTLWQIDGEKVETMRDYFGGSKIIADGFITNWSIKEGEWSLFPINKKLETWKGFILRRAP